MIYHYTFAHVGIKIAR